MLGFLTNKNTIQEDALSGDPKRYERVYISLYQNRDVKNNIERLLREGNSHGIDADEVIQECIIRLNNALLNGKFNGESNIITYFKIICANYVSDNVFRKKKIYQYKGDETDMVKESNGLSESGEDSLIQSEENNVLNDALSKLTLECQEYLDNYYFQGKTMRETAEVKNIIEQSVKNAMSRCREKLRKLLLVHPDFTDRFKSIKL